MSLEQRPERADRGELPAPVHLEHAVDERIVQRVEITRGDGLGEARGIDEDIDAAPALLGRCGERRQRGAVLDIGAGREMVARRQRGHHGLCRRLVAAPMNEHGGAGLREQARGGGADAAGTAHDDGCLARERKRCGHGAHLIGGAGRMASPGSMTNV